LREIQCCDVASSSTVIGTVTSDEWIVRFRGGGTINGSSTAHFTAYIP